MSVTVRVLVVNQTGHILLVRRSATDTLAPGSWDIPGGRQEPAETIEQTAQRETLEETGLRVNDLSLLFATSAMRPEGSKTWLFFAAAIPSGQTIVLGTEHDAYKWVLPAELPRYTDYEILLRLYEYLVINNLPGTL